MNRANSFFYFFTLAILLLFYGCSKKDSPEIQKPKTFVRIEVDNQVYEYFDDKVKREHSVSSFANTVGNLFDTAVADLQGKPAFFISYSGPWAQKQGDFWMTWGTWGTTTSFSQSTPTCWVTESSNPGKRRFTISQISTDNKSWSGDFYYEATNSLGVMKVVKGTYSIVDE